jgi:hypothetical protein
VALASNRPLLLITLVSFVGALVTILILFKLLSDQNKLIQKLGEQISFS